MPTVEIKGSQDTLFGPAKESHRREREIIRLNHMQTQIDAILDHSDVEGDAEVKNWYTVDLEGSEVTLGPDFEVGFSKTENDDGSRNTWKIHGRVIDNDLSQDEGRVIAFIHDSTLHLGPLSNNPIQTYDNAGNFVNIENLIHAIHQDVVGESIETDQDDGDVGMYIFDPDKFDAETREQITERGNATVEESEFAEEQRRLLRIWSENYSGYIRREWGEAEAGSPAPRHQIIKDLVDTEIDITEDEIESAIRYPIWHVPLTLGNHRPLSSQQLESLAGQETMNRQTTFEDEIAEAQLEMGMDKKAVNQAIDINRSHIGSSGRIYQ